MFVHFHFRQKLQIANFDRIFLEKSVEIILRLFAFCADNFAAIINYLFNLNEFEINGLVCDNRLLSKKKQKRMQSVSISN